MYDWDRVNQLIWESVGSSIWEKTGAAGNPYRVSPSVDLPLQLPVKVQVKERVQALVVNRVKRHLNRTIYNQLSNCNRTALLRVIQAGHLEKLGQRRQAADIVYDTLDDFLTFGLWDDCDTVLKELDPEDLPTSIIFSVLAVTAPASNFLPARGVFHQRARVVLETREDWDQEYFERLA